MNERKLLEVIDRLYVDEERDAVTLQEVRAKCSMSESAFAQAALSLKNSGDLHVDETGLITSAEYSHLYKPGQY
jgi:hypothetical protein